MMATAMPEVKIEFYFSSSWVDVSSSLRTESGISVKRGRGTRFDTCGTGTLSFILDNFNGYFTPANTSSLYSPYVVKNIPVRATIGSTVVFTGFVDRWSASVGSDGECVTSVTCSDRIKFLAVNPLGAYGVERAKNLVDTYGTPNGVVYPLASFGADSSAVFSAWRDTAASDLSIIDGASGTFEWSDDSPPSCAGSIRLIPDVATYVGPALEVPQTFNPATGGTIFGAFKTYEGSPTSFDLYRKLRTSGGTGYVQISLDSTGGLDVVIVADGGTTATISSSTSGYDDNAWHTFTVTVSSNGLTVTLYVDGVSRGTTTVGTALTIGSSNRRGVFGSLRTSAWSGNTYTFNGWLSTVGIKTQTWSGAQALEYHNAVKWGDAGSTITTRALTLFTFLYPTAAVSINVADVSAMQVMGQETKNVSILNVLNEIADAERGVVYVDRLGNIQFRGSSARTGASVLTIDSLADLDGSFDCVLIEDDDLFANRIQATGPAGAYTAENATSIAQIGVVSEAWKCVAYQLETQTDARLAARISTTPRIGTVTVDLMTCSAVSKTSVLTLSILDRITLTNLPTQLGSATRDAIVEGYSLNASVSSYTLTLDLSPTG
jgi:hypothetical protein